MTIPRPITDFDAWLATARPGDRCCYYRGMIPHDAHAARKGWNTTYLARCIRVAGAAWEAHQMRRVLLTQQKLGYCDYLYFATKRGIR